MGSILLMGAGNQPDLAPPVYDPNAELFFIAQAGAGVTLTPTEMNAVNQLVIGTKTEGIWNKTNIMYPMVGSNSTGHKFNLKNPNDTDAAFRLAFMGGWTHSATGATPNGTNSYGDTKLNPSLHLTTNSTHVSFYSRTNIIETKAEFGVNNSSNQRISLSLSYGGNLLSEQYFFQTGNGRISAANNDTTGFYVSSRTSAVSHKAYKNGLQIGATDTSSNTINLTNINLNVYLSAFNNNGGLIFLSTKECAFASMGSGLTDAEVLAFKILVQDFQTALGRQVPI